MVSFVFVQIYNLKVKKENQIWFKFLNCLFGKAGG